MWIIWGPKGMLPPPQIIGGAGPPAPCLPPPPPPPFLPTPMQTTFWKLEKNRDITLYKLWKGQVDKNTTYNMVIIDASDAHLGSR